MTSSVAENEPPQARHGTAAVSSLLCLISALGCSEDPPAALCSPDLASIQQAVFVPKCAQGDCHGSTEPAAALDLTVPALASRLVEVPAALCDRLLVVPGVAEQSYLWEKIASPKPACGDPMPMDSELSSDELACIEGWIESMPPGCETCGGAECVDLSTSEAHCGACSAPCPTGAVCEGGQCSCAHGEACGGACVNPSTDPAHCGRCYNGCGPSEVCNKGGCAAGCDPELTQCGASCVDSAGDPDHCGGCGNSCGLGGSCIASACSCGDGIDVQTDPGNCGSCGHVCAPGEACTAAKCTCSAPPVSFSGDVQPIFSASCSSAGCHKGTGGVSSLDLTAGHAYEALVGVPSENCSDGRYLVLPGEPSQSYLVNKLLGVDLCGGTKMPKSGALPEAEVATIVAWICGGAAAN